MLVVSMVVGAEYEWLIGCDGHLECLLVPGSGSRVKRVVRDERMRVEGTVSLAQVACIRTMMCHFCVCRASGSYDPSHFGDVTCVVCCGYVGYRGSPRSMILHVASVAAHAPRRFVFFFFAVDFFRCHCIFQLFLKFVGRQRKCWRKVHEAPRNVLADSRAAPREGR